MKIIFKMKHFYKSRREIFLMVKFTLIIILSFITTSCSYVLLPHSYFDNYTKIINNKTHDTINSNLKNIYVVEDTFLTRDYSKRLGKNIKSYTYLFLYKNNLMAEITTPLINYNEGYIFTENELADSIKNSFFDMPVNQDRISWSYYKEQKNKLVSYVFDYNIASGANALTSVNLIETNYIKVNDGLVPEYYYNKFKDTESIKYNLYLPSFMLIKPDSSKSDFIKMYNKYIATGKRRFYPGALDSDKYYYKK